MPATIYPSVDISIVIIVILVHFGFSPVELVAKLIVKVVGFPLSLVTFLVRFVEFPDSLETFDTVYVESRDATTAPKMTPKIVRISKTRNYFHDCLSSHNLSYSKRQIYFVLFERV